MPLNLNKLIHLTIESVETAIQDTQKTRARKKLKITNLQSPHTRLLDFLNDEDAGDNRVDVLNKILGNNEPLDTHEQINLRTVVIWYLRHKRYIMTNPSVTFVNMLSNALLYKKHECELISLLIEDRILDKESIASDLYYTISRSSYDQISTLFSILSRIDVFTKWPDILNAYRSEYSWNTILHKMSESDDHRVVELLLRHGSNPDLLTQGNTKPIHLAVQRTECNFKIISMLLISSLQRRVTSDFTISKESIVDELLTLQLNDQSREHICDEIYNLEITKKMLFLKRDELLSHLREKYKLLQHAEIERLEMVGAGGFGTVYKGFNVHTSSYVAVKMLTVSSGHPDFEVKIINLRNEAMKHQLFNSEYIVKYIGTLERDGRFGIITEYASGGTLFNIIQNRLDQQFAETDFSDTFNQLIEALRYLHGVGYVYLDLKPGNVLVKENRRLCLGDFGSSNLKGLVKSPSFRVTTYEYCPPQHFHDTSLYLFEDDIFSLGVVMGEYSTRTIPSWGADRSEEVVARELLQGKRVTFGDKTMPPKVANLVKWCWAQEPKDRPSLDQVKDTLVKHFANVAS